MKMSKTQNEQTHNEAKCTNCKEGNIVTDNHTGERVCNQCGFVMQEEAVDTRAEWRAFTLEEVIGRSRTGSATSLSKYDRGLSTFISDRSTDAHGGRISGETRQKFQRLQTWHKRSRLSTSEDRNLERAMNFLSRLSDRMQIPDPIKEDAAYTYRQALSKNLIKGRSIKGIVAASVYLAHRNRRIPKTIDDIAENSDVKRKEIGKYSRILLKYLDLNLPVVDPSRRVTRIADKLELREKVRRNALTIIDEAKHRRLAAGKNPMVIAAAALYGACLKDGKYISQDEVAKAAGITAVSLRNRLRDLEPLIKLN